MEHCRNCGKLILVNNIKDDGICKKCFDAFTAQLNALSSDITQTAGPLSQPNKVLSESSLQALDRITADCDMAKNINAKFRTYDWTIFKAGRDFVKNYINGYLDQQISIANSIAEFDGDTKKILQTYASEYSKLAKYRIEYPRLDRYITKAMDRLKDLKNQEEK